jgi:Tol biopolymer transport system component
MAKTNHFLGALAAAGGALVAVGLLVLMLVVVQARPVGATFPGQNGKIAYAVDDGSSGGMDSEIYTSNPTGGKPFNVTNNHTNDKTPSYSPDGKRIAYSGWDGKDFEIYTINVGGGSKTKVTNNDTNDGAPSYSPNGKRIAYHGYDGKDFEIYTINARGGGGKVQVTYNITGKDEFGPDYSPDGKKIAYSGSSKTDFEIYTINVGGGGKSRVTNNDTNDLDPSWGSGQ